MSNSFNEKDEQMLDNTVVLKRIWTLKISRTISHQEVLNAKTNDKTVHNYKKYSDTQNLLFSNLLEHVLYN